MSQKVLKELYRMKNALNFEKDLVSLTKHHYSKSLDYKKIVDFLFNKKFNNLESLPFLPVKLFKDLNLKSIPDSEIFKVLSSSGTSGNVSKIFLDKLNAQSQTKALNTIISKVLGKERLPMLIADQKINYDDKNKFNAKTAALIGFSIFGKNHNYILNESGEIDYLELITFYKNLAIVNF